MLRQPLRAYLLFGGLEPSIDTLDPDSPRTLAKAELVVAITPFASAELRQVAHVLLPMGTFAESSGTYVNCEGLWQSQAGAAAPVGEARPGWKVLRVLGTLLDLAGLRVPVIEGRARRGARAVCAASSPPAMQGSHAVQPANGAGAPAAALPDVPMYQTDALVRRAPSLQKTREGRTPAASY